MLIENVEMPLSSVNCIFVLQFVLEKKDNKAGLNCYVFSNQVIWNYFTKMRG